MSQIQVSAAEAQAPKRKAITASDELRAKSKEKTPRDPNAPARASGGIWPLALMGIAALLVVGGIWWALKGQACW
jgi:hypothetical protein